ncbi:thioredoxin reductase [Halobacteroides halobius DSM 5150]|uniref:Thioredoxin reductase n=1 Tax=Halobacteroides halobius (strain ATCC 35273 / DSM 5150 / MD-1) TaxID=748449 RepID=L0K9H4_HALHC|nr:NAD(P)/FAD-dependent oxidoreductase [Halobacteroides halobius]AGB41937.1 thioredoxin reductase [Halobacteroides halobius DSM 5150]
MGEKNYDLAIVGAGPAGMSAAINARARDKSVIIFNSGQVAKKIDWAPEINNYLGFSNVTGSELAQQFISHIEDLEVPIINEKVVKAYPMGEKVMITTNGENYAAKKLILAIGVVQEAKITGEAKFLGKGISYCATCDGKLYKDKDVLVISDSNHHEDEANFLADICKNIYYVPQYDKIKNLDERIEVVKGEVEEITGDDLANRVQLSSGEYDVDGIFILRETVPPTEIVPGLELDGEYIAVNRKFETSIESVYAAGDCIGRPLQIGKAVGEGQVAALNALKKLDQ